MLDFRGILSLIHTEIAILLLKAVQNIRKAAQQCKCIDHLVVIVHDVPAAKLRLIAPEEFGQTGNGPFAGFDLLLREHHVFDKGKRGTDFSECAVFGIFFVDGLIQCAQNPAALSVFSEKGEWLFAKAGSGIGDELGGDTVDGAKLQAPCQFFSKEGGESAPHVLCGGPGIGHGQDSARINAAAENHVAQTDHQDSGLSAAGRGKQQHRPLYGENRFPLLGIQPGHVSGFKLRILHKTSKKPSRLSAGGFRKNKITERKIRTRGSSRSPC